MNITAKYNNGINPEKDQLAFTIAKKFGAHLQDSGCFLEEPFERDLEWKVEKPAGLKMVIELRQAGFAVTYEDA